MCTRLIVTIDFLGFVVFHQRCAQPHEIVAQLDQPVGVRSGRAIDLAWNIADSVLQVTACIGEVDVYLPLVFNTARA